MDAENYIGVFGGLIVVANQCCASGGVVAIGISGSYACAFNDCEAKAFGDVFFNGLGGCRNTGFVGGGLFQYGAAYGPLVSISRIRLRRAVCNIPEGMKRGLPDSAKLSTQTGFGLK